MAANEDPRATAKYRLLLLHYRARREELHWTAARFRRLAAALQLTVHELGAFIRLRLGQTETYLTQDRFPETVELHLSLIERAVYPTSQPDLFPDLAACSSTSTS